MSKLVKYFYICVTLLFLLLTLYEIYVYMTMNANYIGIFYLFFNFFIMFLLFTISYNYNKANKKIRISKNLIVIFFGFFSSFILSLLIPYLFNYTDDSYLFSKSIFIISKIIKPIIYVLIGCISAIEVKYIK